MSRLSLILASIIFISAILLILCLDTHDKKLGFKNYLLSGYIPF